MFKSPFSSLPYSRACKQLFANFPSQLYTTTMSHLPKTFVSLTKGCTIVLAAFIFLQCRTAHVPGTSTPSSRFARIDSMLNEAVDSGWVVGAVALVQQNNKQLYKKAFGYSDREAQTKMRTDNIFRIASQTKAITSVAVMMLYDEGKISLNDPLSKFVPAFAHPQVISTFNAADSSFTSVPAKREITIKDLLTHTSGIDYPLIGSAEMKAVYAKQQFVPAFGNDTMLLENMVNQLATLPLIHQPGEKWTYSLGVDVLGRVVEVASGMNLSEFFRTRIFEPLQMADTYFYLPSDKFSRLVKVYTVDSTDKTVLWNDSRNGISPYYPLSKGSYYAGGAGLSSTITDYAKFLQMLLNGGEMNGHRFLKAATIQLMTSNQIDTLNLGKNKFGLGFEITTAEGEKATAVPAGSFAWGGFFGTTYWADPKNNLVGEIFFQQSPLQKSGLADSFKKLVYAH